MYLKNIFSAKILVIFVAFSFTNAKPYSTSQGRNAIIPTTIIAGVTVPNTPIVQAAQVYARAHSDNMTFNHVMRSWLFGSIIINSNETLHNTVDPEAYAVAAILHDLGWDDTGELISEDKRFEVDGAIAARNFIESTVANGTAAVHDWDEHRIQLVWDAIALHATPTISQYKQPLVSMTTAGVFTDLSGPDSDPTHTVTWEQYDRIKEEFPRLDVGPSVRKIICGFARTKPATTYDLRGQTLTESGVDTWMMPYGFRYVDGYAEEAKGHLAIDVANAALPN
ncbi:hypothetical protein LSUE1_G000385 [Lachnellula suecica]|uniref:HD domain-containing protein n=1 Tax=Lachnellula suecica TaxID=602035 RepID=A0A8T9CI33_9HELO|nr:hypothetical protein LSUE1_G000385 [Lachnellula suecica]